MEPLDYQTVTTQVDLGAIRRERLGELRGGRTDRWANGTIKKRFNGPTIPLRIREYTNLQPVLHALYPTEELFEMRSDEITVGRKGTGAGDGFIELDDNTVSRRHCQLTIVEHGVVVRDLGSLNGTKIRNSEGEFRVEEEGLLREYDFLIVGDVTLQLLLKRR